MLNPSEYKTKLIIVIVLLIVPFILNMATIVLKKRREKKLNENKYSIAENIIDDNDHNNISKIINKKI